MAEKRKPGRPRGQTKPKTPEQMRAYKAAKQREYRAKWKLAPDYPMVAPAYAKQRSDFAKKIGLGRKAAD